MAGPIHYEVFLRKTAPSAWTLAQAVESRAVAMETAEQILKDNQAVAVRVTKETLDPETMEFTSVTILTRGVPELKRKTAKAESETGPTCVTPHDLYTPQAREKIGEVLEDWLNRNGVTAFELLHRPDMVERLDASGVELQHAIQKIAVPESQSSGRTSHDLMRHYQRLVEVAVSRVISAGQKSRFFDLEQAPLAHIASSLVGNPERAFIMGGTVSAALAQAKGARARLGQLMDLADQTPAAGPQRALVMVAIEQILCEMFNSQTVQAELLGPALDVGSRLAAILCMIAPQEVETIIGLKPQLRLLTPRIDGPTARLADRLAVGELPLLTSSMARRVRQELLGPCRLRPSDPKGEIEILRLLATILTMTAGRLLTLEEVQIAFVERSKLIITADFVGTYADGCETVLEEAEALTHLCENVTGAANKRSAARWLSACVGSLRFETELRKMNHTPSKKLVVLSKLQRSVLQCRLQDGDRDAIVTALGSVGGQIESDSKLVASLGQAKAPVPKRLGALLRLAIGENGPLGPVAERAKTEAIRLLRNPQTRSELGAAPQAIIDLKPLMQAAGLAA